MLKEIQAKVEQQFAKQGFNIEWTFRTDNDFTISGQDKDVRGAAKFASKHGLAEVTSIEHDEELGETFAYLSKAA